MIRMVAPTKWCYFQDGDAVCGRCAEREVMPLPLSINALCHWTNYFAEKHRYCTLTLNTKGLTP